MPEVLVRDAIESDAETIFQLIIEFAEFDRRSDRVTTTVPQLMEVLRSENPPVRFVIAEFGDAVGFASFYTIFSTATGKPGLCLEDIFVRSHVRRHGVGKKLVAHIARIALETGCIKMEWTVGSENAAAIAFYESIGAPIRSKARVCRMGIDALRTAVR